MSSARRTAIADQAKAAEVDAIKIALALARGQGAPMLDVTRHPAIAALVRELHGRMTLGLIHPCRHAQQPQVLWYRAWRDELLCSVCSLLLRDPIAGTDADFVCDRCGRPDRHGRSFVGQTGAVLLIARLCQPCIEATS